MRSFRLSFFFLAFVTLLSSCSRQTQTDWLVRADLLDQYAVSGLTQGANSSVIPNEASDAEVARRVEAFEDLLDTALDRAWKAGDSTESSLLRLAGIDLGITLRRLYGNKPLKTSIKSLAPRTGCSADLSLGRHFARYSRALAAKDTPERLLTLAEWQNGINCLSARQSALLAEGLGASLMALRARMSDRQIPPDLIDRVMTAFVEPVLLLVDATKGILPSAAHWWAIGDTESMGEVLEEVVSPVHLYDFVSGNLVQLSDAGDLGEHLDKLLDPANIGLGTCGFIEMLGTGLDSGRFNCGRGVSCGSNPFDLGIPNGNPSLLAPADLASILSRPDLSEMDFSLLGSDPTGTTALGVPISRLSDSCGGASGDGSAGSSFGPDMGFMGCMFRGAIANARDGDMAYCTLESMRGLAAQPGGDVVVGGIDPVTGAPVIKGIFGNRECATNPLAEGDDNTRSSLWSPEGFKDALRNAKMLTLATAVAAMTLNEAYLEELGNGMIDRWGTGTGGATTHTTADQGTIDRMKQTFQDDVQKGWPWESGEKSAVKARLAQALDNVAEGGNDKGALGTYDPVTGEIKVDEDKHIDFANLVLTVLDELSHAVEWGIKEATNSSRFAPSENQLHLSNYAALCIAFPAECAMVMEARNQQANTPDDDSDSDDSDNTEGGDGTELPVGPHGPDGGDMDDCSALAKSMKAVMACHDFDEVAPGFGNPGGPGDPPEPMTSDEFRDALFDVLPENGGDVDPSHEQWIASMGSGLFGACMAQHGLGVVGIDGNGVYVIGPAQGLPTERCQQQISCPPPGLELQIGASCRCSAPSGVILRDHGALRLCQTSDACFPDPNLLDIQEVREVVEPPGT